MGIVFSSNEWQEDRDAETAEYYRYRDEGVAAQADDPDFYARVKMCRSRGVPLCASDAARLELYGMTGAIGARVRGI